MTKIITFITLLVVSTLFSQTNYEKGMQEALQTWEQGNSNEAIAKFERIASVEKENILPNYYIALINTIQAFGSKDKKEMKLLIEKAQKAQDLMNELLPNDAEVLVMQAMIHTASIVYDPMTNGQRLSGDVMGIYSKAAKIAPENPRVVLNKAEFEMGTAQYFGGDTKPMCAQIAKSIELFANFKPESPFHPSWGLDRAQEALQNCK